jgi:N utilization substance protein B
MGVRREGREAVVQYLYQRDLNPTSEFADLAVFYKMRGLSPSARRFSDVLIRGIISHQDEIDAVIRAHSAHYELHRISAVDRNVLRLAIYEMLHCPEVPPVVSINEGIEIARKYSTEESSKFVNGILDQIRITLGRPARTAGTAVTGEL